MRRTITINETATLLSLKLNSKELRYGWCRECSAEVVWIALPMALESLISQLSEARAVHMRDGRVCSRSLMEQPEQ